MNIEELIKSSVYPEHIKNDILNTYMKNPKLFLSELRKAENNSKRAGIKNKQYNLWIATNNTYNKYELGPYECYYCHMDLTTISSKDVRFEHFVPKLHIPSNIVLACKWCDEFKKDRMPEDFESIIFDEENVKRDKYANTNRKKEKLIEFAPLVACHSMGASRSKWLDKMVEIASKNYKIDLNNIHSGQVRWRYYELFRDKWYQK